MKKETKEMLLIGGVVIAFTALGFLAGLVVGSKKDKQLVVTSKGELKHIEVD